MISPSARELINRGNNLFGLGMIGMIGIAAIPELPTEGGIKGAIDETAMVLIGVGAWLWYFRSRYKRTLAPVVVTGLMLAAKVFALITEDPDDRGDDIGIAITILVFLVGWGIVYFRTRNVDITPVSSGDQAQRQA